MRSLKPLKPFVLEVTAVITHKSPSVFTERAAQRGKDSGDSFLHAAVRRRTGAI